MNTKIVVATAAALFAAGSIAAANAQQAPIKCAGINACKGQNACKGKGFVETGSTVECTVLKSK